MTPNLNISINFRQLLRTNGAMAIAMLTLFALTTSAPAFAQSTTTSPSASSRFLGTISLIGNGVLTVKTDAGAERKVTVPDGVKLQRIAPGEKDLSKAATIQFADLAVGDRVLVRLAPDPATDPVTAISIVAIPQADLAQKQQKEREEWQHNGVGGLVKTVNPGTGNIMITSGAGSTQKTVTLHTTPTTILRRYALDSISFDEAKPAPLEVIKVGDQLRARGTKSADGTEVAAEEVVSGTFRNISGTITSINAGAMTVTLKDLSSKQTVNVHIGTEAQMRKLPEAMAKMLASTTRPGEGSGSNADAQGGAHLGAKSLGAATPPGGGSSPDHPTHPDRTQSAAGSSPDSTKTGMPSGSPSSSGDAPAGRRGGGDAQQMLARAPVIHLSDLQKGDAVMLVSTQGTTDVTAITLLAGVEPLLQAPASTQNMLLSNWNMSSGGAEAAQ